MEKLYIEDSVLYFDYNGSYEYETMMQNLELNECIFVGGIQINDVNYISDTSPIKIRIGEVKDGYVYFDKSAFNINYNFAIEENSFKKLELRKKDLIICRGSLISKNVNLIKTISDYVKTDCYIVDKYNDNYGNNGYILDDDFKNILSKLPNEREIKLYKEARLDHIVNDYFDNTNGIEKYNHYINSKSKTKLLNLNNIDRSYEIINYEYIISTLENALKNINVTEEEWQNLLAPIIPLLFPRYVRCYSKVPVIQNDNQRENKELDFLLADIDGNVCIIELKKPFSDKSILKLYRNNYAPCKEFGGAIQQIHRYIWDLNNFKDKNTKNLENKYGGEFKLINPQGVLIYGRSNNFNDKEKLDFEIIRKQYKDIVDIITYDDLIDRLKRTIAYIKNNENIKKW